LLLLNGYVFKNVFEKRKKNITSPLPACEKTPLLAGAQYIILNISIKRHFRAYNLLCCDGWAVWLFVQMDGKPYS